MIRIAKPDELDWPTFLTASFFGIGTLRPAPGSLATLAAVLVGIILLNLGGHRTLLVFGIIAFITGYWACHRWYRARPKDDDPATIVIDEVFAMWLVMACLPPAPPVMAGLFILISFALFRFFDIKKIWPVNWADRIPGAQGTMLDDFFAAAWAVGIFYGLLYLTRYLLVNVTAA